MSYPPRNEDIGQDGASSPLMNGHSNGDATPSKSEAEEEFDLIRLATPFLSGQLRN